MKKTLFLLTLLTSWLCVSQIQPIVYNTTFDDSACACTSWINKDIADQGESSTTGSSEVLKFDDLESDGIYQEIAIEANSNYTLNFSYIFSSFSSNINNLEIYVLKGSGYESGYTPAYPATTETDLGYRTIADVETATNQISTLFLSPPTHTSASIASLSFDTGAETSIAIFVRSVGPFDDNLHAEGTQLASNKNKGWMNGNAEVRIDNFSLVNNGLTVSYLPVQPTVYNTTFDDSACACTSWINKDIADQGETSTTGSSEVLKFDDLESDGIYQEIAVEANSNYTLNFSYIFSSFSSNINNLEIYVLKGSGYESGYIPAYSATTETDLGYRTIADVETATNQISTLLLSPPTHTSASIASLSFDTGAETSIAIFVRSVGPFDDNLHAEGTQLASNKNKGWMNGNAEVRIDNLSLVNNGYSNNVWQGGSSDWATDSNWGLSTIPTAFNRVVVANTGTNPIIDATTGVRAYSLNVNSAAALSINSGGSLIVTDTSVGDVTYNIAVTDTNWHLATSPVSGEDYDDAWVTANSIASGTTSAANRGIATYQNGTADATTGNWVYMQGGASGTFDDGVGYSILSSSGVGNISFTGKVNTSSITPVISQSVNNWNLIGNSYTSYLDVAAFITVNTTNFDSSFQAVYVWNGSAYVETISGYVHPGQAFFVSASSTGTAASFTMEMQSHQTGTTFLKNSNTDTSIELNITDGTSNKITKINYLEGKTLGLDPGFDIGMFTGVSSDLSLYTQLVNDNEGIAFARQALPNSDIETSVIPLGMKAAAGKEITFFAESLNLPTGIKVFLEDRFDNVYTRLDEANTSYKITLTEAVDGVGRFYLHTSSKSSLSIDNNVIIDDISIFKSDASTLRIVGLQQGNISIKLFNILGKQMMSSSFYANGVKDLALPNLANGVYIVQLVTESGKLNKKIILE
ncbi:T9SS type A sorting domain-containing protein [uncultured Polaribacter sp.]|uniref:T9SS type A sorting domain-containing protein n=1 Tax=uncultured Polaribacter sp. TaxID=174711 RepID=UPI002619FF43|nr:T9SS type A sorting domain-containing protein [uncultured Polaribacter sp.]